MVDLKSKVNIPIDESPRPLYARKQIGHGMTLIVAAGLACIIYLMSQRGVKSIFVFYTVVLACLALLFSSMTVTVAGGVLTVKFGMGLIRKRFTLSDIASCRVVTNPWYYGWGIRRIPGGWFFGVAGKSALELTMRSGKRFRIGSADPEELKNAIEEADER